MKVIGIDPGRATGWAVLDEDGTRIASGEWDLSGDWPSKFDAWLCSTYMDTVIDTGDADVIVAFEHVTFHRSNGWRELYYGQKSIARTYAEGGSFRPIGVGDVKETAGSRVKDGILFAARDQWGSEVKTHNEADALWIAETARRAERGE